MKTLEGRKINPKVMEEIRIRAVQRVQMENARSKSSGRLVSVGPVSTTGLSDTAMAAGTLCAWKPVAGIRKRLTVCK